MELQWGNHLGQVGLRGIFFIELAEMGGHTLHVGDTFFWDEPWTGLRGEGKLSTSRETVFHCSDGGCEWDVTSYQVADTLTSSQQWTVTWKSEPTEPFFPEVSSPDILS